MKTQVALLITCALSGTAMISAQGHDLSTLKLTNSGIVTLDVRAESLQEMVQLLSRPSTLIFKSLTT